ncbi:ATP synthase F0 subunit B [Desulfatibacillum aliphaticivorans]|uniref:F0F1 ATP synthase subunit B family protein n=1 Tax=Desulfatibacillum aliphaticivorans TaxID=218208 RepID=UPI00041E289E|nr:ATP synthase F0 subunit B [Desulfatibacillum aliphaticivorans]
MKLLKALPRKKTAWLGLCLAAVMIFAPWTMAGETTAHGEAAAHAEAVHADAAHGEAAHGEAAAHGGEGGHGASDWKTWKDIDYQKVLNFAILFGFLFWVVRKPAGAALTGRIEDIQKELDDLEARRKAASEEVAAINARLQNLEGEAQKIVDDYVAQGEVAREKILAEARKAADRLTDQAQRHMEHEVADAKKRLRTEILEKAIAMGEQLIAKNITEQDQDRLVGEYLDKVVTQ